MTKEAREHDIQDNINFLKKLLVNLTSKKTFEKIILLGFSQGGATAARFYVNQLNIDHLILWACVFPSDLHIEEEINFEPNKNYFILGSEDQYFNETEQNETIEFYKKRNFKILQYSGNHSIDSSLLNELLNKLK
jgi:predicted esterase